MRILSFVLCVFFVVCFVGCPATSYHTYSIVLYDGNGQVVGKWKTAPTCIVPSAVGGSIRFTDDAGNHVSLAGTIVVTIEDSK